MLLERTRKLAHIRLAHIRFLIWIVYLYQVYHKRGITSKEEQTTPLDENRFSMTHAIYDTVMLVAKMKLFNRGVMITINILTA